MRTRRHTSDGYGIPDPPARSLEEPRIRHISRAARNRYANIMYDTAFKQVFGTAANQQLLIANRSIEQAGENLRLNRDYYRAGTSRMSDLLEAQLLYQQACDKHTDAFADHQNKLLEYRQAVGM